MRRALFRIFFVSCLTSLPGTRFFAAESNGPYRAGLTYPKLTTPQWIGESDVDAVVILSIDDMRDAAKYEGFLRPLLDRLKSIDGRAPVSIFTNSIDPDDPQLQSWLKEGLSLEVHTVDHPCPLLKDGDFPKAKSTYDRCVDMMSEIPGSNPVAFRMPCCDSLNTPSPRFWAEIFEKQTSASNYLAIDSSVFNIFTADDLNLPNGITTNEKGEPRFRHYLPFKSFVNTIENYPYPYIVGKLCWEFPCVVPSDWEAQNVQQPNNPDTVRDLERALDATVIKQGVMPIVFHPHGWIRSEQLVEFVDYAVEKYGSRVKFLTFADSLKRINKNLLDGVALRTADGNEHNVRLVDVNSDGYLDVMRSRDDRLLTRIWNPANRNYLATTTDVRFRDPIFVQVNGELGFLNGESSHFRWREGQWVDAPLPFDRGKRGLQSENIQDIQAYDVDGDGTDEIFVTRHDSSTNILSRQGVKYESLPYEFPTTFVRQDGGDAGVRLVDLNHDHHLDIVKSDGKSYGVWLFVDKTTGWKQVRSGQMTDADAIPMIARPDGTNNGAWFHTDHLWVQNEYTDRNPDLVDRIAFEKLIGHSNAKSPEHPLGQAKDIAESLATFQLPPGARLEVAAAEPEIQDPIAFDWGPNGELWVVEMGDYPNGANWHGPGDKKGDPGGRVKKLEDKDGDGRFETSHVFLDGLGSPTGVKAWRNGVIITAPPNIIYAEDLNGDHKADGQKILYTGMREGNQQHRANGLRWGLDHWIHLANGDSGGVVQSKQTNGSVNTSGRDFRVKPDEGLIELTSGPTQYGRSRDSRGNWFGGDNSHPVRHYVLDEKYMRRNPHFSPPSARREIAEVPGAAPVFPTSETVERFNDFDRANRFTSACSPEIYRDNTVYVCEPVHNLVHRSALRAEGVSFTSTRRPDEQQTDFLTSSDNWFRPVMVRAGPDEAIWVADMYRMVIEHPEWIPMQWQQRIDHLSGNDKGRIYRIVLPESESGQGSAQRSVQWKKIGAADTAELVDMLDTDSRVLRDMVQQEIVTRNITESVPHLRDLRKRTRHSRIAIDYLLDHFGEFDFEQLKHTSDLLAPHILRLIEPRLAESARLRELLIELASTPIPNAQVRIQAAYTLGHCDDERTGSALANIALHSLKHEHDRYIRAAVMSSVSAKNVEQTMTCFLSADIAEPSRDSADQFLGDLVSSAIGFDTKPAVQYFVSALARESRPLNRYSHSIATLLSSAQSRNKSLSELLDEKSYSVLLTLAEQAAKIATNQESSESARLNALKLFGRFPKRQSHEQRALTALLSPMHPQSLQREAIRLLGRLDADEASQAVFSRWSSFTPALRDTTLSAAIRKSVWTSALLDEIENGAILPVQVGVRHRQQLLNNENEAIRNRAGKLFRKVESNRSSVVQEYASHDSLEPNIAKGKLVFQKQCAACHRLEGQGSNIGPDLTAISDKSLPAMLTAILDPNVAVEEKYLDYTVLTAAGELQHGILLDESATAITLATPEGKTISVLRNQLEQLKATGKSLMPEGLEQVMKPQDVADVVGYVQSISVPRKQFKGNTPQVAPVRDDGSIRLFAMHAEIYGPKLVLEEKYRNLGFWSDATDRAVWTINAPKAGEYELRLDYACSPQPNTNRFLIRVNGQAIGGEVEFTDSWDTYRSKKVGVVELPDKPVQLTIQSEGQVSGFLMDLRTILLYPTE